MYALPDYTPLADKVLTAFAVLAIIGVLLLCHYLQKQAQRHRDAQFERDEALRIQSAAQDRQDWIAGIMKEYDAPVPTENVPTTR